MPDNPSEPGSATGADPEHLQSEEISSARVAYNIVSDTVTGLNVRKSDNKLQAIAILVMVLLLATLGAVLTVSNSQWDLPWYGGALFGAFAGLVIGVFGSGIFLMIYRAMRHIQGKHE